MTNGFLMSQLFLIYVWFPYYFMRTDCRSVAPYITALYPSAFPLGTLIYNYFYEKGYFRSMHIIYVLLVVNIAIYIAISLV